MKNKGRPNDIQSKYTNYTFTTTITTIAFPLLFGRQKKTQPIQEKTAKPKPKPKGLAVDKYELTDNIVKFFAAKGFPKKRWVLLKEFPIAEVEGIESFSSNDLSLTWNGVVYAFVLKKKSESFDSLRDQIQALLVNQTKTDESIEKAIQRKSDLTAAIDASMVVVDLSFNVLMGLHGKRIDWASLEGAADSLGSSLNFKWQTLAPLNVGFSNLSVAIKQQIPKEIAQESYAILKMVYEYFDNLKPMDNEKVDFEIAKSAIGAYYTLNDLLFAKVIGEKDNGEERLALEGLLLALANSSEGKISFDGLWAGLDKFGPVEGGSVVEDMRRLFREQLKLL
jgi:hypothetical protein